METSFATSGTWLFNSSGLFCSVLHLKHTFLFGGMFLWTDLHLKKNLFLLMYLCLRTWVPSEVGRGGGAGVAGGCELM